MENKGRSANSGLAKGGVWCFYESEVLNPNFALPMKLSARKPALRQAAKRYRLFYRTAYRQTKLHKKEGKSSKNN